MRRNQKKMKLNKYNGNKVNIATVIIQTPNLKQPSNQDRTRLLKEILIQVGEDADIILLPAGFYVDKRKPEHMYNKVVKFIRKIQNKEEIDVTVCLGIDGNNSKDQVGLAINKQSIISIGRKFYPTIGEVSNIYKANNYLSTENDFSRIFELNGKKLYIAICYDGFGIRKLNLENPYIDGILNLVHGFYPQGYGGSGEVYFAKYSFAGSSRQWNCPSFGAAVFFNRDIPSNWPSGVLWNQGQKSIQEWKYVDNGINPKNQIEILSKGEKALVRIFSF